MPRHSVVERLTPRRQELERSALLLARMLVDRTRSLYRELEARTGAPVQMHRALSCVALAPGIQPSRLARELGMERSAMSHLLRTLEERGWMTRGRDADDLRNVQLYVTAAGRSVIQATSGEVAGILHRAVRQLSDRELIELERSLTALQRHVEKPGHPPPG